MGVDRVSSGWTRKTEEEEKSSRPSQQNVKRQESCRKETSVSASSGSCRSSLAKLRGGAARQGTRRNLGTFALDFRNKPECQISANKCQPTGTGAGADTGTPRPQVPVPARLAHRQQQACTGSAKTGARPSVAATGPRSGPCTGTRRKRPLDEEKGPWGCC